MKSRELITRLLNEWLEMTHRESHAIKMGKWSELARIQKAKADLQGPLTDAIETWKAENPHEFGVYPFRDEVSRLLEVEAQNSDLLAVRKREVREKILLLEQALDDLRRLHAGCDQSSKAA
jgi:outer membrane PBP1 activator LpoA protein